MLFDFVDVQYSSKIVKTLTELMVFSVRWFTDSYDSYQSDFVQVLNFGGYKKIK